MGQLKPVGIAGWLKDVNDNFASLAPVGQADGVGNLRVARFTFDTAVAANLPTGAHGTGVIIPAGAVIVGGFFQVITPFTSAASDTGTIAISVKAANDIQTAAAVSGAPYSTAGQKAITPKANTPESTGIALTAAKEITCTVAIAALTAGKLTGWLYFVE